jgi:uncharacterized membrane protein
VNGTGFVESASDRMDTIVGTLLLGGVLTSLALIIAGLTWHWLATGHSAVEETLAGHDVVELLGADLRALGQGAVRPRLLISLGIVALLLTPYLRVLASMLFFAFVEQNWKYTAFTAFVLIVLTYSLVLR